MAFSQVLQRKFYSIVATVIWHLVKFCNSQKALNFEVVPWELVRFCKSNMLLIQMLQLSYDLHDSESFDI